MDEAHCKNIIENTDRRLYRLNNELSQAEYRQDCGDESAGERVDEITGKINGLLTDKQIMHAIRGIQGGDDTKDVEKNLLVRKARLLEQEIVFSGIETDASLQEPRRSLRNELKQIDTSHAFSTLMTGAEREQRRSALKHIAQAGRKVESRAREMFHSLNWVARNAGFDHYLHAKLAYEGLTVKGLYSLFEQWREEHLPLKRRIISQERAQAGHDIQAWDILYLLQHRCSHVRNYFDSKKKIPVLDALTYSLGKPVKQLPIVIEHQPLSFGGACYRMEPGKDIRIMLNTHLEGYNDYFYMFHEFGHAIYYCFCPRESELLIDNHLSREIMADLWTHFLTNKDFLTRIMDFSSVQSERTAQSRKEYESFRILIYMRDAMFTVEALQNPDLPFDELWREVNRKWLDMDDDTGAIETFDMYHPLDMKSYVFAQVLSARVFQRFNALIGELLSPLFLEVIVKELYRPGNQVDWWEKFQVGLS